MEFTLRYQGRLYGDGGAEQKHRLRKGFHEQVKLVWLAHNTLQKIPRDQLPPPQQSANDAFDLPRPLAAVGEHSLSSFMFRYSIGGFDFVPLITFPMEAHCYLNIRMGRPTRPGSILFGRRDIDNRVKILVDALRMPHHDNEVPKDPGGNKEMFCLLADDNLVTRLSITSYRLLSGYTCDADIDIDIDVTIRPITAMIGTSDLLFRRFLRQRPAAFPVAYHVLFCSARPADVGPLRRALLKTLSRISHSSHFENTQQAALDLFVVQRGV